MRRKDLIIYANRASRSAGLLGRTLTCRRWLVERPRLDGGVINPDRLIINWGTTLAPNWFNPKCRVLNKFSGVEHALSKRRSYELFRAAGVATLESSDDPDQVRLWLGEGRRVLARRDGLSSGQGIRVLDPKRGAFEVGDEDFYSPYFKKTHEYRFHVFGGGVIDVTQKKLRGGRSEDEGRSDVAKIVRSLDHGWVHAHGDIHLPSAARDALGASAIAAVSSLGLDFGAVDVLARYSSKDASVLRAHAVCEVNTAPGLENEATIAAYTAAIQGALTIV